MKKLSFLILTLCVSTSMWAWGAMGHRIIAEVAYHYLSPEACADVDDILGVHGMVYWATWPDEIKSTPAIYPTSYDWHYQDMPAAQTDEQIAYARVHYPEEGGHLWGVYDYLLTMLPHHADSYEIVGENVSAHDALVFLIHLSGDLCCPVHCGQISDKGGNDVKLEWYGTPVNLHKVWDEKIIQSRGFSYTEYAQMLVDKYGSQIDSVQGMTNEEVALMVYHTMQDIYAYNAKGDTDSHHYMWQWKEKCDYLLFVAGVRLANNIVTIR